MKQLGQFLLEKRYRAAIVVFVCALAPVLSIPFVAAFATIVVGLVTLQHGPKEGALVLVWAALPGIGMAYTGHLGMLLNDVVFGSVLVWLLAVVLLRTRSWSLVLELTALVGMIAVAIVHVAVPDPNAWWEPQVLGFLQEMRNVADYYTVEQLTLLVKLLSSIATGLIALFMLLGGVSLLFIARWWQGKLFNPGGLRKECYQLRMGKVAMAVLLVIVVLAFMRVSYAIDVLPMVVLPFFLAGLSVVHVITVHRGTSKVVLPVLYLALIFLAPYVAVTLAMIGLVDSVCDFRTRLNVKEVK